MKTLNLDVKYDLPKTREVDGKEVEYTDEEISVANAQLSLNYIETAVLLSNKDGLDSQFRRLWVIIQSKISMALNSKEYKIEIDDGEFDFIKRSLENAKFNPTIAKYVVALEDEILGVK